MPDNSTEKIDVRITRSVLKENMIDLYKDAGWWDASYDPGFLDRIVKDSALFAGAFIDQHLIGMGRVLSDMASDAYIQDVVVLNKYRGRGIGKKIIRLLVARLKQNDVDWIGLVAQPGTSSFYKNLGFEVLKDHVPMKFKNNVL